MGYQGAPRDPAERRYGFQLQFVPYDEGFLIVHRGQMKQHGMKAQI